MNPLTNPHKCGMVCAGVRIFALTGPHSWFTPNGWCHVDPHGTDRRVGGVPRPAGRLGGLTGLLAFVCLRPALLAVAWLLDGSVARATSFAVACIVITYALTVSLWVMRSAAELAKAAR